MNDAKIEVKVLEASLLPSVIKWGVCPPDLDTPCLGVEMRIQPLVRELLGSRAATEAAVRYSPEVRRAVRYGWRFGQPVYHPESDWIFLPLRHACRALWTLRPRRSR